MNISNLATYLGLADCYDGRLALIASAVEDYASQLLGDISYGQKTIQIRNDAEATKRNVLEFLHRNVTSIVSINGTDFSTKVEGTDYKLLTNDKAIVPDLYDYIDNDFGVFDITYWWGYKEIPATYTNAIYDTIGVIYSQDMGRAVNSETTGPHTVSYADTKAYAFPYSALKKRLSQFVPVHLRYW